MVNKDLELRAPRNARSWMGRPSLASYTFPRSGEIVGGRYKIVNVDRQSQVGEEHLFLGEGGGGRVYLAEDQKADNRIVAIKFYKNDDDVDCDASYAADVRDRFVHEGVLLKNLGANAPGGKGSRYLPAFYGSGVYGAVQRPYIVMERLVSVDAEIQKSLSYGYASVRDVVHKISKAARFLLDRDIIPLDLKLANVMRRENGELVLIDLGLVDDNSEWSRDENRRKYQYLKSLNGLGTAGYMPPYRTISVSNVIWALGSIIDSCFFDVPLPLEWCRVVIKCHRLNQEQCYQSLDEFETALDSL